MSRFALIMLLSCLLAGGLNAQTATHPEGVGLVLGGGGARGAAHIGVLKVLEREHIPVSHIAGTSMGSIVGALYASGYSADEIEAVITAVNWRDMLSDDPPRDMLPMRRKDADLRYLLNFKFGIRKGKLIFPRGVLQGQKLLLLLRRLTLPVWDIEHFDQLPIPFRCIGTDIGNGAMVVFEDGDLALAIRASMSVPAAFAPIRVNGRMMVDGGIVNNVPVDVVQRLGARRLIAVNVSEPLTSEESLTSPLSISNQMLTLLMKDRTDSILRDMNPEDVLITPDLGDFGSASFDRSAEAIAIGEQAAMAQIGELRAFAVSPEQYARWRGERQRARYVLERLAFVDVSNTRSRSPRAVADALSELIGKPLDPAAIESGIATAYGQGQYERILWKPHQRDGEVGIEVTPVDKGWGPNFLTFGLQLSDDFEGRSSYQLAAEASFTGYDLIDGESRVRIDLGQLAGFRAEHYLPVSNSGRAFLLPFLDYRAENQPLSIDGQAVAEYRIRKLIGGVMLGYNISNDWRIEAGLIGGESKASVQVGADIADQSSDFGAISLGFSHDTLDNSAFPTSGNRTDVVLRGDRNALGNEGNGEALRLRTDQAFAWNRHHLLLGLRGFTSWGQADLLQSVETLGGFGRLSGYTESELIAEHGLLGRAVYYRRFGDASRLFSVPAYAGGSLELGNVWTERRDISVESLITAGSLFLGLETPFGPMFLGYGLADTGESSVFLTFGSLLGGQR
jgi:NTE family protein